MADLIDRDAAAYKVKSCITIPADNEWDSGYNTAMAEAKQYIQNAPAVNRWISVEDALPDSTEDVLVWFEYFRYGEYDCLYQTYGIGNYSKNYDDWIVNHETGWDQLRVIAWMPLPEPPEKE